MSKKLQPIFLLALMVLVAVIWYTVFYFEEHQNLLVTFFDIGQGDAALVEIPGGNQILIDGGPSSQILSKIGKTLPFWDRSIDLLILTHPHADHLDGLLEILKRYEIDMVIESGVDHSIPEYKEWQDLLEDKKTKVIIAKAGQKVKLGRSTELQILSPFKNFTSQTVKNIHEAVVTARLKHNQNSILFMGDAEKSTEYRLLFESLNSKFLILDSSVLKVGHHGSKTSSAEEFLKAISPKYAIISAGRKNRYGHPHQEVLDRFEKLGIKIFRTDLVGDVHLISDGISYVFGK
ncbi:MAG: ComEC/Rec2 family competence protein [bacterium]|nr:ComEC/Rec2 family competence protein [bacterium]